MLIRRKERSIPWTCEYRFERAIPPVAFGLFSFQAFGSLLGRFIKGLVFHQRSDTRFFNGQSKKYTPTVDIRFLSTFFFFSLFLKLFEIYFAKCNKQTLYFIFEIFHFFFFQNIFQTFFPLLSTHTFLNYSLFFVSSLCFFFSQNVFIFHDCRVFVSVLISNLYFFPLIFPRFHF